jgi:hypothetical protein
MAIGQVALRLDKASAENIQQRFPYVLAILRNSIVRAMSRNHKCPLSILIDVEYHRSDLFV